MTEYDPVSKKRHTPILAKDNWERWFKLMKAHLESKSTFYVTHTTMQEFAWISRDPGSKTATGSSSEEAATGFEAAEGTWNIEKKNKFLADSASVYYLISISVDDLDNELIDEHTIVQEMWKALKKKYSKTTKDQARKLQAELMNFKIMPGNTIAESWASIKELRRRVVAAKPELKPALQESNLFDLLLAALPDSYTTTRDALDVNDTLDISDKLAKLEVKEARVESNQEHQALAAKPYNRRSHSQSDSDTNRQRLRCYDCEGKHTARHCPFKAQIREYARSLAKASRKKDDTDYKSKHTETKHKSTKKRGYVADEELGSSSNTESSSDSSGTDEETGVISKEIISKVPSSQWVADSGASSHMTDQLHLFRSPLKQIKRRAIRVGGGKLYTNEMGTVELHAKDGGSVLLSDVLYVPTLGVNLLSGRKMCAEGLKGSFNDKAMYFKLGKKRVIKAKESGGVYIVSHIAPGFAESAYNGAEESSQSQEDGNIEDHPVSAPNERSLRKQAKEVLRYTKWHRRFSHLGPAKIGRLHIVTTLARPIRIPNDPEICEVCKLTKMRNSTRRELSEWKKGVLDLISLDVCGPFPTSLQGNRYFAQLKDNRSRKEWTLLLKAKSDIIPLLQKWKIGVELESGEKVKAARSDNAPEIKLILEDWCTTNGIRSENTVVHTSSQNGVAERSIQTSENSARAMLKDAKMPIEFWDEAVKADTYLRNRTATGPIINEKQTCPEEAYSGEKPSIDHIRVWGSKCYSYVNPTSLPAGWRHDKLVDRGRVAVFVGYCDETTKQYRVYAPDLGYTIRASVVTIDEEEKGGSVDLKLRTSGINPVTIHPQQSQGTPNDLPDRRPRGRPRMTDGSHARPSTESTEIPLQEAPMQKDATDWPVRDLADVTEEPIQPEPARRGPGRPRKVTQTASVPDLDHIKDPDYIESPEHVQAEPLAPDQPERYSLRKRKRGSESEGEGGNSQRIKAMLALIAEDIHPESENEEAYAAVSIPIPQTYRQAVGDKIYGKEWEAAIAAELSALQQNGTWEVMIPPPGSNLVTSKWVFTIKHKADGTLERFKARLVARGFSQSYGRDYTETFAPTVRMDTLRIFLAIVAAEDLECHHIDIKNAFTESHLKEQIYLAAPDGINVKKGYALHVLRSLYGLKQAARDWNLLCKKHLLIWGLTQSKSDPCVYTNHSRKLIVIVYVDDILVAAASLDNVSWFKNQVAQRFKTKDLGEIEKVLGIRVARNRQEHTLCLDQERYLDETLTKYGIPCGKHHTRSIPMANYNALRPASKDDRRVDITEYQSAVGSLMYAMVHTRPDISFALGKLSQYMTDPAEHHRQALKTLLRYLRSTITQKMRYGPTKDKELILYSDADWASDKVDRKSTSGSVSMLYGGAVSWGSRKQRSVATSSTEAEYMAMASCAKQGQWTAQVLRDMDLTQYIGRNPSTVDTRGDNQGALALVKNPHLHERSKHIDVSYHYIRNLEEERKISVTYIPTDEMVADGFTKPLARIQFDKFKRQLGLVELKEEVKL